MDTLRTARGRSLPLGATALFEGVNFSLLCRHGTAVKLVIFPLHEGGVLAEIPLDPHKNRTGNHWHVQVVGLPSTFRYGWTVDGPVGAEHRFNPNFVLFDPACTALAGKSVWGTASTDYFDKKTGMHGTTRRSLFVRRPFDWHEDAPLLTPLEDTIIYELHVRGFTCHPTGGVAKPGTFAGLVDKIPYLKDLGITAVELLPVHEFDEDDCPFSNPLTGEKLRNFWGYNSIAFAAPKAAYAAAGPEHGQVYEFREMVRAFHNAGIEVFLDVVFNHTGEGDDRGRTYSFRGLDNCLYYMLSPQGTYLNFSGCGNTVNCNHPVVRDLIMTCLHYWVADMHVDGLRFDLASVFGRDSHGNVLMEPPIVEMIAEDGVLADTKLIAEPWDAGGLYQVGKFHGKRWSEWNGRFRDDIRRFWRGDQGMAGELATRMCGSSDLYESNRQSPLHSINFITCHDGFTLSDLVSFNHKHNNANGEDNRDGSNDNFSWNCVVDALEAGQGEGPTRDIEILELRVRQAKNLMATLLLSQGVPMLLAGDEFLRTQKGNNNAWCQDNDLSWVDWSLVKTHADFHRFVKMLIALRKRHPAIRRRQFFRGRGLDGLLPPDIIWHGVTAELPDFSPFSRTLAFALDGSQIDRGPGRPPDRDFYVVCNAWIDAVEFQIPGSPSGKRWRRAIDTALPSPLDILDLDDGPVISAGSIYPVEAHSMLVLISEGIM